MRQFILPVLLLTTVALTSSKVLPVLSLKELDTEPITIYDQENDNTLSSNKDNANKILYALSIGTSKDTHLPAKPDQPYLMYIEDNNLDAKYDDYVKKDDNYDNKGFRKEQWHNYPRQMDRLQMYLYGRHEANNIRNSDDDESENDRNLYNALSQEIQQNIDDDSNNIYDAVVAASSPLLILKIQLAQLNNKIMTPSSNEYFNVLPFSQTKEPSANNNMNGEINVINVKQEESNKEEDNDFEEKNHNERKLVKKRIFSLWSRLQGLSHKGHELHHRRHLHAFYGLPDSDGGGVLTAETRASFIRPPGSPLRWG